jgi:murein hydrolase activator
MARGIEMESLAWAVRIALLCVCCSAARFTHAEDRDASAKLQQIKLEVSETEKVISNLKSEFSKLKKEEKSLSDEIQRLSVEEGRLVQQSATLSQRREVLGREVQEAEQRVAAQQARIRSRLRNMYEHAATGHGQPIAFLLTASNVERMAVYARAVRGFDERQFNAVRVAVDGLIESRRALEQSIEQGSQLQQEVQKKRLESERKRTTLTGVLQEIKSKQQAAQQSLALLRLEATKLEEILRQVLEEGVQEEPSQEPTSVAREAPKESRESVSGGAGNVEAPATIQEVMAPEGLFGRATRVTYPVKGEVVQRFGKAKVTDFADMIFSKGLEFKTAAASQVSAILGGRIAFAGSMPGYDSVVIIDHGKRSYSLYGRLGKIFVAKGDLVRRGGSVGVTSELDAKGRNFYFETRKNGDPIDPMTVLGRAASAGLSSVVN